MNLFSDVFVNSEIVNGFIWWIIDTVNRTNDATQTIASRLLPSLWCHLLDALTGYRKSSVLISAWTRLEIPFSFTLQPEVSSIRCWQTNDKKTHTMIINVIVTNTKQEGKFPMNQKLDWKLPWSRMKLRWNFSCIWSTSPVSNRLRLETSFHFLAFLVHRRIAQLQLQVVA